MRTGFGLLAALFLIGGVAVAYRLADGPESRPETDRPALALLTSLPLVFGEQFAINGGGSRALARLERRYTVEPIAVADAASLQGRHLLLMAHPRAQPAEVLVELDTWVRNGGRVVLLADPRLLWESSRPLGDALRPPPAFADTGLLGHWGLVLGADDQGQGGFRRTGDQCTLDRRETVARCAIGNGRATIIADADFLMIESDDPATPHIDLLIAELARIEAR